MSKYTHSLVILCPAEHRAAVEQIGIQIGHSGNEYTVPLAPDGSAPASHFGLCAWAQAATVSAWTEAAEVPPLTAEQVAWLRSVLVISARADMSGREHFDAVLAEHGLQQIFDTGE